MTEEDWYVGARQGHTHMVGWGGLEVNGGHVTAEDILNETNYDWRSLVAGVWISELLTAGAELAWPRAQHALGSHHFSGARGLSARPPFPRGRV